MPNDVALRRFQLALEGPFSGGVGVLSATQFSIYGTTSTGAGFPPYPATRRMAIEKGVTADFDYIWEAPVEARGSYAGAYQHILHQVLAKGKIPAIVYADDLTWYGKMCWSGAPLTYALPAAAAPLTNVLASTALNPAGATNIVAGFTAPSATTGAPAASMIEVTIINTASSAPAVVPTIVGTDINNTVISEAVNFSSGTQTVYQNVRTAPVDSPALAAQAWAPVTANTQKQATLYTKNYFKTVTAVTTVGASAANYTITLGAVNAFQWTFDLDMGTSTLYSATAEYFDGTGAWQLPGTVAEKFSLTAGIGKSLKVEVDFLAKNKPQLAAYAAATTIPGTTVGSQNTAAATGTQLTLGNLSDSILPAIPTYLTRIYVGNLGTDPGTSTTSTSLPGAYTQLNARLTDYKISLDNKLKLGKAADGTTNPNFVGRDFYGESLMANFTLLFNSAIAGSLDPIELQQFFNNQARTVRIAFPGVQLPCGTLTTNGGWNYALQDAASKGGYYGIIIDMAGRYTKVAEKEVDNRMALDFEHKSEVDTAAIGSPAQMTVINRISPNAGF